ncbi:hypothetical protein PQX77_021598 [Marasmius sp. AFHP31]|nr:hypothetical protein PQX77_021598 [Marasmius sp. AFHP31]
MAINNDYTGSGDQNNNNLGTQNIRYGDRIVNHYNPTAANPHKNLWDAIAGVGASHKDEQQFLRELECLEGTREKALEMVYDWRTAKRQPLPMCWLSGAAGVGKSAIAMSVAKSAENDRGLVGTFFFFRSDSRRNNPSALVLTIAHGLTVSKPSLKIAIEKRVTHDPTILRARLEEQFRELVLKPCTDEPVLGWLDLIREMWEAMMGHQPASEEEPALVILDGLDECGDDKTQLRVLSTIASSYQQSPSFPLRFLICSRPESWIRDAFHRAPLSQLTKHIVLDESFLPGRDIERYYLHAFKEIRERPENARVNFSDPWPSEADLEILVQKSSGQFVYATTAVKLIGLHCSDPVSQLEYILSYTPNSHSSKTSSFPELDQLYHIILSISPNHKQLLTILAAIFTLPPHAPASPEIIELLLGLPTGDVDRNLRFMHSVLNIGSGDVAITAYHTSFTDFLYDPSRSEQFYIDRPACHDALARDWLRTLIQQVEHDPDVLLDPGLSCQKPNVRRLLKMWTGFCLMDKQPTEELYQFYSTILSVSSNHKKLLAILAAIFIIPPHASSSPESVGLLLELPTREVFHALRFMHFVLNIRGRGVAITAIHTSFTDFLYNDSCSGRFYIDRAASHNVLACQWLRTLARQVQENPNIILNPNLSLLPSHIQQMFEGWIHFCPVNNQPTKEIIEERDNFLWSIVSAFPDRQKLLTNMATIILLPAESEQSQLLHVLGLASGISSTKKSLQMCQLATWHNYRLEMEPFFYDFLQQQVINLPESRDYLAQHWIQTLSNNLPISQ